MFIYYKDEKIFCCIYYLGYNMLKKIFLFVVEITLLHTNISVKLLTRYSNNDLEFKLLFCGTPKHAK